MDSKDLSKMPSLGIDSDGVVLQCAKGGNKDDCGYVAKSAVCGKCGSLPTEMKMLSSDLFNQMQSEIERLTAEITSKSVDQTASVLESKKLKPTAMEDAGTEDDEYLELPYDDKNEDEVEEAPVAPLKKKRPLPAATGTDSPAPEDESEDDPEDETATLEKFRQQRLAQMGIKSSDVGNLGYKCAMDSKVYPSGTQTCNDCSGGCTGTKGQITLLHAEGYAQTFVKGEVVDSGYVSKADMFVVTMRRKDAKIFDIFIDGASGQIEGHRVNDRFAINTKSDLMLVTFDEAGDIATKSIPGTVVSIEPDSFEGVDSYAVEIESPNGKSYDVFVSLDGEVLGYDKYEVEDIEMIEAEAAEIALKRAFSEDARRVMAETGDALPDGSFPIKSEGDLRNAIQAYGRADDKTLAKKHIIKRAHTLGQENLIPADWVIGGKSEMVTELDEEFKKSLIEFQLISDESSDI